MDREATLMFDIQASASRTIPHLSMEAASTYSYSRATVDIALIGYAGVAPRLCILR